MTSVLVTHADTPVGKSVAESLIRDPNVDAVFAIGKEAPPRRLERYLRGAHARMFYRQIDLCRHRSVSNLFNSEMFRQAGIDTVVYIPCHAVPTSDDAFLHAGLPRRVTETRLILQACLRSELVENVIALGSAYVYRLPPGNANRLDENSQLDMDPHIEPNIRAWIDSDMMIHGEVYNARLRVDLLRIPTVVANGGHIYFNPVLPGGKRPRMPAIGFDPMCPLVSIRDVTRAIAAALHSDRAGVFNISGNEAVPLRGLARGVPRKPSPEIFPRAGWLSGITRLLPDISRLRRTPDSHLRYGFTLDTRAAEHELGFRATDQIYIVRDRNGALSFEAIPA